MKRAAVLFFLLVVAVVSASDGMQSNKLLAQRVFDEILTGGQFEKAAELYAPDFVNHGRSRDASLAEDQAAARGWRKAAPDLVMTTDLLLAEGDLVAVLWRSTGTNTGEGNGLPATGKRISGRGITVWRIRNGKLQEEWSEFNMLQILQQAGLLPGGPSTPQTPQPVLKDLTQSLQKLPADTVEKNRQIAKSVFEQILGQGKLELFDSIYARDFANHGLFQDSLVKDEIDGTNGFRQLAPDLKVEVTQTVAEGEFVAVTYLASGTNTAAAMGYPATGKSFVMRGMSIFRIHEGKIRDEWSILDQYQALKQLGLLSSPGAK